MRAIASSRSAWPREPLVRGSSETPRSSRLTAAGTSSRANARSPGCREQLARPLAERPSVVVERLEPLPVAVGLLEVVAEELVRRVVELEPAGEALVEVGARPLRDPGVGGVPDQRVPEAEAVLAGNARDCRLDELAADEPQQRRPEGLVAVAEGRHGAGPELLADDGRPLEHVPLEGIEAVEPSGEERLDRRRELDELHRRPRLLGEHRDELLGVERIPLGHLCDARAELRRQHAAAVECGEELCRVPGRERLEPHERALPPRPLLEQLRPGDAEEQDRCVAAPAADVLDEVEQRRLGPVDVLEENEQRTLRAERLEQPAHGPEELLRRGGSGAAEHPEALDDERCVGLAAHRVRHRLLAAEPPEELRRAARR